MVRALWARFWAAALRTGAEEPVDAEESQKEIQAIGELILSLGGRESNSPGKVWSSPSDVPAALGSSRGPVLGRAAAQEGEGCSSSRTAPVLRNAGAEEILLCGPDWPRWRWSWKPLTGAPTVGPPKLGWWLKTDVAWPTPP